MHPHEAPRKNLLTPSERRKLAGVSDVDERAILRWEHGEPIRPITRRVLEQEARRLGLPIPEAKAR
jgi:hypothetical protein